MIVIYIHKHYYIFKNGPLQYTYTALINYIGNDNEYLLGLLLLLNVYLSLPNPKHFLLLLIRLIVVFYCIVKIRLFVFHFAFCDC